MPDALAPRLAALAILAWLPLAGVTAELTPIPGTRVSLAVPPRFVLGDGFRGIIWKEAIASVAVTELPTPAAQMRAQLTAKRLAGEGMALIESTPVRAALGEGVLLHVEQNVRGHEFRKWILVAGDAANTVMLTASVPQSLAEEVGPMLRPVLMTATWDRGAIGDPRAGLGFEFTETADLKVARGMGATTVVLTRGGDSARVAFSEPMLVLGKSTAGEVISDLGVFSRARLAKTRTIGEVEVREEKALELAGMPAHELVAAARGARDATPVTVYQALAYDGADYYLIQGFVGPGLEERFLPQFREIARSLKPR